MNKKQAQTAAHAVIDHLASLERPSGHIENPDAWRKTVRNRIRTEVWSTLMDALSDDHAKATTALIKLIAPSSPAAQDRPQAPTVEVYEPEPWEPASDEDVERTKAKLAEIRRGALGGAA